MSINWRHCSDPELPDPGGPPQTEPAASRVQAFATRSSVMRNRRDEASVHCKTLALAWPQEPVFTFRDRMSGRE